MKSLSIALLISGFNFPISLLFAEPKTKPNILLFIADDMGLGDTSAYLNVSVIKGSKPITKTLKTPNFERFLGQVRFFPEVLVLASFGVSTGNPYSMESLSIGPCPFLHF